MMGHIKGQKSKSSKNPLVEFSDSKCKDGCSKVFSGADRVYAEIKIIFETTFVCSYFYPWPILWEYSNWVKFEMKWFLGSGI